MKEKDRQTGQQILSNVKGIAELADSLSQYSTPESSLKSHVSNIGFVGFSTSGVPLVVTKSATTGDSPGFYLANPNAETPSLTPLKNVSMLDKDLYRYEAGGSVYSIALKEHYQGVWHRVEIQLIRPKNDGDKFAKSWLTHTPGGRAI
jgi:hypothetical protein